MKSPNQITGGITYANYLQDNPTLAQEPSEIQAQVALEFFNKRMSEQPGWEQEPEEVKQQAWQQFRTKYNVPEIKSSQVASAPAAPVQVQQGFNPLHEVNKGLTTLNLFAGSFGDPFADAMAMGYTNTKDMSEELARQSFPGIEQDQGLLGMAYRAHQNPIANQIGELAGMINPSVGLEQLAGKVVQGAGMLPKMIRSGSALAAYEGLKNQPMQQRLPSAMTGFGMGAALPPLAAGAGKVLQGAVRMIKPQQTTLVRGNAEAAAQAYQQAAKATKAAKLRKSAQATPAYKARMTGVAQELESMKADLPIPHQKTADRMIGKIKTFLEGKGELSPDDTKRISGFIKNAPRKSKMTKGSSIVEKAKAKQQDRATAQNPEVKPEGKASQADPQQPKAQTVKPGKGGKVSTRQGIKSEAAQAAKTGEFVEFDYSAEGGRSRVNEERIVAEGKARDGRTEAKQIGGEDLSKQQGYRKEVVVEVKITKAGDTAMVTKNEAGEFRTRIIEGKGQGSRVNWIRRTGEMPGPEYGTADAADAGKMYSANRIAQIQKALEDPEMPETLRKAFNRVMKSKKLSTMDYLQINKHADDPKFKQIICDILGLSHG